MSAKLVLVSEDPGAGLERHLAGLDLPRRSLSLPVEPDPSPALPSLIELWGDLEQLLAAAGQWPFPARAWRVREFVPIAYERTWASGAPSPGVRMVSTLHRRPDRSRAQFESHWRGPHTEVATHFTVPFWNYVQNVVVEAVGHDAEVDGFVGMHFRSAEALRARWADHPEEAARGAEDAAEFMVAERSESFVGIETVWDTAGHAPS